MKKRIWIINPMALPLEMERRKQTWLRAAYLVDSDCSVFMFSGTYLHDEKRSRKEFHGLWHSKNENGITHVQIANISYGNNSVLRVLSLLMFYSSMTMYTILNKKPHIIDNLGCVPAGALFLTFCKIMRIRLISTIVDLWPEGFVSFGFIARNSLIHRVLKLVEKYMYFLSDRINFSMPCWKDYLSSISCSESIINKSIWISNPVDIDSVHTALKKGTSRIPVALKEARNAVYIGTLGKANAVLEVVKAFQKVSVEVNCLIFGDGEERSSIEKYIKVNRLRNVFLLDKSIPSIDVPSTIADCDISILNYQQNDIFKYGGSQTKLFMYLAIGNPIIGNIDMPKNPINEFDLGICRKFCSSDEYAKAMSYLSKLSNRERNSIQYRSKEIANKYDYKYLGKKYENEILLKL